MTSFERRQRILNVLRKQPGIKVNELARALNVSEGTIRNDLRALDETKQIRRVRGGAVLVDNFQFISPAFAERFQIRAEEKQRIAHRAADLIEDGDSILLDASTTVFHLAPFLQQIQNLTIVTNGFEIGLTLAKNPSHTVIMVGGVLRPDGTSLIGHLGEKVLSDLHIKTAFISCSGFTVEAGLTETDIQEIQLKSKMIRSADRVVALIDSSKMGKVGLTSFGAVEDISQIFTDDAIDPEMINQIRESGTSLCVCGGTTVSTFSTRCEEATRYKIGFANLSEEHVPFSVDVRKGLEQAAKKSSNVDLFLADNQLSGEVALKVADDLITAGVDLAIEYQIDEKTGNMVIEKFKRAGIPVIAVDIPMVGATFFGVDNYRAGHMAGIALGKAIRDQWHNTFDCLIVLEEPRAGALPAARIQGQLDGLQEIVGSISPAQITHLTSGNTSEESENQALGALRSLPHAHRLAVICFNDDAAIGVLNAARKLKREQDVLIVGQGADRRVRTELRRPGARIIGSTAYWPERYGEKLLNVAFRILRGEPVPPAVHIDHSFIEAKNIDEFYPE